MDTSNNNVMKAKVFVDITQASKNLQKLGTDVETLKKRFSKSLSNLQFSSKFSQYGIDLKKYDMRKTVDRTKAVQDVARAEYMNKLSEQHINLQRKTDRMNRQIRMSYLGVGFALLFTGMAIKRVVDGWLKALFTNYKEVMGQTSEFNQMTNQLSGAWTFLKFTMVDALMQTGLLQSIIGWLINIIDAVSAWAGENPELAKFAVIALSIVSALSLAAMIIGQLTLAWVSFSTTIGGGVALAGMKKFFGYIADGFFNFFSWVKPLWSSFSTYVGDMMKKMGLKTDFITKQMIGNFIGFALAGALAGKLIYEFMNDNMDKMTKSAGKKFAAFLTAMKYMFQELGVVISSALEAIGNSFASLMAGDIIGANKWAGKAMDSFKKLKDALSPSAFSDHLKVANEEIRIYDELMAERNPEQAERLSRINSILSAISAVAISGVTGFAGGGAIGAAGAILGSGISAGLSSFNDIKDLSDTVNPQFEITSLKFQEQTLAESKKQTEALTTIAYQMTSRPDNIYTGQNMSYSLPSSTGS